MTLIPRLGFLSGVMERRKLRPQKSINSTTPSTASTLNKSQSTGELANRNENGSNQGKAPRNTCSEFEF